jgi:hypothetical protein
MTSASSTPGPPAASRARVSAHPHRPASPQVDLRKARSREETRTDLTCAPRPAATCLTAAPAASDLVTTRKRRGHKQPRQIDGSGMLGSAASPLFCARGPSSGHVVLSAPASPYSSWRRSQNSARVGSACTERQPWSAPSPDGSHGATSPPRFEHRPLGRPDPRPRRAPSLGRMAVDRHSLRLRDKDRQLARASLSLAGLRESRCAPAQSVQPLQSRLSSGGKPLSLRQKGV